jgi:hypothetical protein
MAIVFTMLLRAVKKPFKMPTAAPCSASDSGKRASIVATCQRTSGCSIPESVSNRNCLYGTG